MKEHGWFRTNVFADAEGPGFSFTTGFWLNAQHPEVIVCGLKSEVAHDILWDLFRDAKSGKPIAIGQRTLDVFGNFPAYAFPVAERFYADHLGWSRWFYAGDSFPCVQIVWPDRAGVFPWEEGFDVTLFDAQPDLTEHGWNAGVVG